MDTGHVELAGTGAGAAVAAAPYLASGQGPEALLAGVLVAVLSRVLVELGRDAVAALRRRRERADRCDTCSECGRPGAP